MSLKIIFMVALYGQCSSLMQMIQHAMFKAIISAAQNSRIIALKESESTMKHVINFPHLGLTCTVKDTLIIANGTRLQYDYKVNYQSTCYLHVVNSKY